MARKNKYGARVDLGLTNYRSLEVLYTDEDRLTFQRSGATILSYYDFNTKILHAEVGTPSELEIEQMYDFLEKIYDKTREDVGIFLLTQDNMGTYKKQTEEIERRKIEDYNKSKNSVIGKLIEGTGTTFEDDYNLSIELKNRRQEAIEIKNEEATKEIEKSIKESQSLFNKKGPYYQAFYQNFIISVVDNENSCIDINLDYQLSEALQALKTLEDAGVREFTISYCTLPADSFIRHIQIIIDNGWVLKGVKMIKNRIHSDNVIQYPALYFVKKIKKA